VSKVTPIREAALPDAKQDVSAILGELHAILASRHFCHSKRYPALLRYLVENALAGRADLLKERTLSMEVFDRPASYDLAADSVVRYTVGEVRKRLVLYYSEEGRKSEVRITLPIGSYVPEFIFERPASDEISADSDLAPAAPMRHEPAPDLQSEREENAARILPRDADAAALTDAGNSADPDPLRPRASHTRRWWIAAGAAAILIAGVVAGIREYQRNHSPTAVSAFWAPVLENHDAVVICTGSVVFARNDFSGVITADKEVDYSFVSMQNAAAMARVNGWLERSGASTQVTFAASEPLPQLREHSIALLGGYNNLWTMRLVQPLRFYFTPEPVESIADRTNPRAHWARDHSLPYSSAGDYALLARFRDPTIDGWVVVLAGLGRNGTEAAAEFAVSDHYMQLLRDRIGRNLTDRNLEVVLKVKVIDGKTGAPSIVAVNVW
jgi:hypothetical protein